jgi:hypothetical protein
VVAAAPETQIREFTLSEGKNPALVIADYGEYRFWRRPVRPHLFFGGA